MSDDRGSDESTPRGLPGIPGSRGPVLGGTGGGLPGIPGGGPSGIPGSTSSGSQWRGDEWADDDEPGDGDWLDDAEDRGAADWEVRPFGWYLRWAFAAFAATAAGAIPLAVAAPDGSLGDAFFASGVAVALAIVTALVLVRCRRTSFAWSIAELEADNVLWLPDQTVGRLVGADFREVGDDAGGVEHLTARDYEAIGERRKVRAWFHRAMQRAGVPALLAFDGLWAGAVLSVLDLDPEGTAWLVVVLIDLVIVAVGIVVILVGRPRSLVLYDVRHRRINDGERWLIPEDAPGAPEGGSQGASGKA